MDKRICEVEGGIRWFVEQLGNKRKELLIKEETLEEIEQGKNLEAERKQLLVEELVDYKAGLEKIRSTLEEQLLKIHEEKDQLRVTEERSEHLHLQ
ncbi:hypothetical protein SAY87_011406 [Trapa incisa]|uniref:Uncharacterized protein n=1 Tax=Trapa incisa TaxID=236973 RepID=A0AAN7GW84_9MYRT|nr:hypothetical protein SAY87_011406 [Trapa incisa]